MGNNPVRIKVDTWVFTFYVNTQAA